MYYFCNLIKIKQACKVSKKKPIFKMMVKIDADKEQMKKLRKIFGVTDQCIYAALSYRKNNDLARQIRFAAVNNDVKVWQVVEDKQIIRKIINQ